MFKIYLISANFEGKKVYKIGFTKRDIEKRIKEFKTGNSSDIILESYFVSKWARKIEKTLHRHFQNLKINGEWFELNNTHLIEFQRICKITHDNIELLEKNNTWVAERGGINKIKF